MAQSYFKKTFSVEDIPDLSGKVALVTGGSLNIGLHITLALLDHNAIVYVASRSRSRFDELSKSQLPEVQKNPGNLRYISLDLSSVKSCIAAAEHFLAHEKRLDILVANAALQIFPETLTPDGYEMKFGTNHLGHFVLVTRLLPLVKATAAEHGDARIVVAASSAHLAYRLPPDPSVIVDFDDVKRGGKTEINSAADVMSTYDCYARSKLANIAFARTLHARLRADDDEGCAKSVFVNAVNPGTVGGATMTQCVGWVLAILMKLSIWRKRIKPAAGALGMLLAATDPEIREKGLGGMYLEVGPFDGNFRYGYSWDATNSDRLRKEAKDDEFGKTLWEWSEAQVREIESKQDTPA